MATFDFKAIGTTWKIDIFDSSILLTSEREKNLYQKVLDRIDIFDRNYSRFRNDSLVTEISKKAGTYTLPDDAKLMMELYFDIYKRTNGLVTPLIGQLISDAGYDAVYSLKQKGQLSQPPRWEDVLIYEYPKLTVNQPVLLDFGAAGKGYLVDIVGELLEACGINHFCIDAGGDILVHTPDSDKKVKPIRIGLEHPDDPTQAIGVYEMNNGSICGSAGNRRVWGDFTHIINPHTLSSPREISAVWVIAKTAIVADALATCLFFVSPDVLVSEYDFQYVIVRNDHSVETSLNFTGEIFAS